MNFYLLLDDSGPDFHIALLDVCINQSIKSVMINDLIFKLQGLSAMLAHILTEHVIVTINQYEIS